VCSHCEEQFNLPAPSVKAQCAVVPIPASPAAVGDDLLYAVFGFEPLIEVVGFVGFVANARTS
jgi:hypothetical protein